MQAKRKIFLDGYELLRPGQVMARLGVSRETLSYWRKRGEGPPCWRAPGKTGNSPFFYPKDRLEAWMVKHLLPS